MTCAINHPCYPVQFFCRLLLHPFTLIVVQLGVTKVASHTYSSDSCAYIPVGFWPELKVPCGAESDLYAEKFRVLHLNFIQRCPAIVKAAVQQWKAH